MSVRSTIQSFYGADAPNALSGLLDRYRDEERRDALREAAEKIRREIRALKAHGVLEPDKDWAASSAADLIDPDKEDQ